eukprot:scaffold32086_cov183-Amphora_coffeaeformis.AAC.27
MIEIELGTMVAAPEKTDGTSGFTKMQETTKASAYSKVDDSALNMDKERSGCEITINQSKDDAMILPSYLDNLEAMGKEPICRVVEKIDTSVLMKSEEQRAETKTSEGDLSIESTIHGDGKDTPSSLVYQKEIIPVPLLHRKDCNGPWKTILLIGDTLTGKSTAINSMVNYLMAVQYDDPFTYRLVADSPIERGAAVLSLTKDVTAYNFYPLQPDIHYGITIIDTPGFCDSVRAEKNRATWKKIKDFVKNELSDIDAVCFTIRDGSSCWSPGQQYCYEKILKLFGKDIVENLFAFITFSDTETPLVTASVRQIVGLYKGRCVKLDNSAFLRGFHGLRKNEDVAVGSSGKRDDDLNVNADAISWGIDCRALRRFFTGGLLNVLAKSVRPKCADTSERESLENVVVAINNQIRNGLDTLECIRQSVHSILQHQQELDANSDLKVKIPKATFRRVSFRDKDMYATTCLICNFTYHQCRNTPNDDEDVKRHAIERSRLFRICQQKCKCGKDKILSCWIEHSMEWVEEVLLQKDEAAEAAKNSISHTGAALHKQRGKYITTKMQIRNDIDTVRRSIERLKLRPGDFNSDDHIQQMIESELMQRETGFRARVQFLEAIKEEESIFSREIHEGNFQRKVDEIDSGLAEIDGSIDSIAHDKFATKCDNHKGMVAWLVEYARGTQGPVTSS